MSRTPWLDEETDYPQIAGQAERLDRFVDALADGRIDEDELEAQRKALVAALKAVEPELDDALHAKITTLLVELSAYNVMNVLHGLAVDRARGAFG